MMGMIANVEIQNVIASCSLMCRPSKPSPGESRVLRGVAGDGQYLTATVARRHPGPVRVPSPNASQAAVFRAATKELGPGVGRSADVGGAWDVLAGGGVDVFWGEVAEFFGGGEAA
jgi:hypothetical protein